MAHFYTEDDRNELVVFFLGIGPKNLFKLRIRKQKG